MSEWIEQERENKRENKRKLDALGADGWEAVGMAANDGAAGQVGGITYGLWVLLKRPKP